MSSELVYGGVVPGFLDDDERTAAQDGNHASAGIVAREIALANQIAHAGRPFYSWAYDNVVSNAIDNTTIFRQVYMATNRGATTEGGRVIALPHKHDPDGDPGFIDGQGVRVVIGGTGNTMLWNYSTLPSIYYYPSSATVITYGSSVGYSATPMELTVGSATENGPQPRAGTLWQDPANVVDSAKESAIGSADVVTKGDIIGVRAAGDEQLTALIDSVRDSWFHQRPQMGWSYKQPGTSSVSYVDFTTSKTALRYIFNQAIGAGGTNFSISGPAVTLPLANAAGGIRTQLRVYVFVYAAMSGTTDHGTIGVANRDSAGTMATAATALTNGPTISGTTFQWYPSLATWSATTGGYFLGYAGGAYDRIGLCAASSGSTDSVRVAAFTFIVAPATS